MRTVHFIAIGGSAMHNLAIALHRQGFEVTGSDDEIFEPSRSRLDRLGLLPDKLGWSPEDITPDFILKQFDQDANGSISRDEAKGHKVLVKGFQLVDTNRDNVLDRGEIEKAIVLIRKALK